MRLLRKAAEKLPGQMEPLPNSEFRGRRWIPGVERSAYLASCFFMLSWHSLRVFLSILVICFRAFSA
jgi:hypothetical protein